MSGDKVVFNTVVFWLVSYGIMAYGNPYEISFFSDVNIRYFILYQKQQLISPINRFFFPLSSLKILVIATAMTAFFALI